MSSWDIRLRFSYSSGTPKPLSPKGDAAIKAVAAFALYAALTLLFAYVTA
jgi:hypothetical protein